MAEGNSMLLHGTMIPREGVRQTLRHPLESQWIAGLALVPGLLEAFGAHARLLPDRESDLDLGLAGKPPEERARLLVWHGHSPEALRIGRLELGLSAGGAVCGPAGPP
jgi:hypothetical protein